MSDGAVREGVVKEIESHHRHAEILTPDRPLDSRTRMSAFEDNL